jgi:TrpR family transcriptional regulator, trp operon repressor
MKQKISKDGWQGFLELCSKVEDPQLLNLFFDLFLTFEEREIMTSRYLIIKALLEGQLTQREIAEKYKVSIAQITRGSNALKAIAPKLKQFLGEHFHEK